MINWQLWFQLSVNSLSVFHSVSLLLNPPPFLYFSLFFSPCLPSLPSFLMAQGVIQWICDLFQLHSSCQGDRNVREVKIGIALSVSDMVPRGCVWTCLPWLPLSTCLQLMSNPSLWWAHSMRGMAVLTPGWKGDKRHVSLEVKGFVLPLTQEVKTSNLPNVFLCLVLFDYFIYIYIIFYMRYLTTLSNPY